MIYMRNTMRDLTFKNIASFKLTDDEVAILDGNGLTVFYKGKLAMHLDFERTIEMNIVPKSMQIHLYESKDNGNHKLVISNVASIRVFIRLIDATTSSYYVVCKDKHDLLYEGIIEKIDVRYSIPDLYAYGMFIIIDENSGEVVTRYYLKGNDEEDNNAGVA